MEEFEPPTFHEYQKATHFARFRYKYSLVVLILCWIALIILIIFVLIYSKEISTNPLMYAAGKIDGECTCTTPDGLIYKFNSTSATWREKEGWLP